jgi:hypothetical protein
VLAIVVTHEAKQLQGKHGTQRTLEKLRNPGRIEAATDVSYFD